MTRWMNVCERCGDRNPLATTMSRFNEQTICVACNEDEKLAPNYAKARAAEEAACRRGDFNFPGIGLAPEDVAFLAERRKARVAKAKEAE